jgi:dTDP-D-glucose 4,6-dehydratase
LDWQPQVDLQEGLVKLVEWYRTERDWVKDIDLS